MSSSDVDEEEMAPGAPAARYVSATTSGSTPLLHAPRHLHARSHADGARTPTLPGFAVDDRVSVEFSGRDYPGTITEVLGQEDGKEDGNEGTELLYVVSFDDGEVLRDVRDEELTRLSFQQTMPKEITDQLLYEAALSGPRALKVGDRLRVWWEDTCYEGTVTECTPQLGVDCRPTLALRIAYDDGDDQRHMLDDFPLEKISKDTVRAEPQRHTRVTPKELTGKRTRSEGAASATAAAPAAATKVAKKG